MLLGWIMPFSVSNYLELEPGMHWIAYMYVLEVVICYSTRSITWLLCLGNVQEENMLVRGKQHKPAMVGKDIL